MKEGVLPRKPVPKAGKGKGEQVGREGRGMCVQKVVKGQARTCKKRRTGEGGRRIQLWVTMLHTPPFAGTRYI